MIISVQLRSQTIGKIKSAFIFFASEKFVCFLAAFLSVFSTGYFFLKNELVAYGDAESHLNIAKRVVSSLTPGLGQLGGIWLPLPHVLMIPFAYFNSLYETGLAGSIVSGISFLIASVFIYRLTFFLTKSRAASFFSFLVFSLNPNILYLQSTPMTESLYIALFVLSIYYFLIHLKDEKNIFALILAAIFGFLATLTKYDGWFLVLFEVLCLAVFHFKKHGGKYLAKLEGKIVLLERLLFLASSFGCFGIL